MGKRLVVIPRWAGTPASDWYPWLQRELGKDPVRTFDEVVVPAMPNPNEPTISAWVSRVRQVLGADPQELARTVIVGHSVGCQAVLRALAELPEGLCVNGVLCVAGWFWTDAPWPSLMPWIETPLDVSRARDAAAGRIAVLLSDNDPHTWDWRANRKAWQERLNATAVVAPGASHFNSGQSPIVLKTLLDQFGQQGE